MEKATVSDRGTRLIAPTGSGKAQERRNKKINHKKKDAQSRFTEKEKEERRSHSSE